MKESKEIKEINLIYIKKIFTIAIIVGFISIPIHIILRVIFYTGRWDSINSIIINVMLVATGSIIINVMLIITVFSLDLWQKVKKGKKGT